MEGKKHALPPIIWNKKVSNTYLENFTRIIKEKYNQTFGKFAYS